MTIACDAAALRELIVVKGLRPLFGVVMPMSRLPLGWMCVLLLKSMPN